MANQGADGLHTLDASLAQLAVVNPAVRPWLDRLAAAFRQAASANIPFARSVMDLAALLQFLSVSSTGVQSGQNPPAPDGANKRGFVRWRPLRGCLDTESEPTAMFRSG
jgi:hypothetical protein